MKMKSKYILTALLLLAIMMSVIGCGKQSDAPNETQPSSDQSDETEEVKIKYVYKTQYVDFAFISDEQKESWRPALVSLLNNKKTEVYEKEAGLVGYSYLYPDRPCIENGYQLALFDINTDGMPELLVNLGGGTAGNAFYCVYDILTGQEIGTLDGGHNNSWCIYFNKSTGEYEAIGQFQWRSGWMGKERFVNKAIITTTMGFNECYLHETHWMYAYYEIDAAEVPLTEEEIDKGYHSSWDEIYPGVYFAVNDGSADINAYFAAQDEFVQNYIRITETGIRLIDWDDVTDKDDDVATKAEKMADALLSSKQEYVQPLPEN